MSLKFAFAGDRKIAVQVLKFLLKRKEKPLALLLAEKNKASHAKELKRLCSFLKSDKVFYGKEFTSKKGVKRLKDLGLDYIISIHFPYIYPKRALTIPKHGALNLHPAYLPYNRGWHTPSWAILDKTPFGATLHFMDEKLDTGDIVHQKKVKVLPSDTANSLYQRALEAEYEVFKEAWSKLKTFSYRRMTQKGKDSSHTKKDLGKVQRINLRKKYSAEELIDKIRALTTNRKSEAAYFVKKGKKYRLQIKI